MKHWKAILSISLLVQLTACSWDLLNHNIISEITTEGTIISYDLNEDIDPHQALHGFTYLISYQTSTCRMQSPIYTKQHLGNVGDVISISYQADQPDQIQIHDWVHPFTLMFWFPVTMGLVVSVLMYVRLNN